MPPKKPDDQGDSKHRETHLGSAFPPTEWSMVLRAQKEGVQAARAMDDLCRRYWYPIYAFLRGRGFPREDAQDLTQGFFLKMIRCELIGSADQEKGRLRSYFLGALNRHLADHFRTQSAVKRGGRAIVVPLECQDAERQYSSELLDHRDPEKFFLIAWARSLLERTLKRVRAHYQKTGRGDMFSVLEATATMDEDATPYRDLAEKLQANEAALRIQVFRIRQRFAKVLREEVAQTVHTPDELEEELAWLQRVLKGE
jgi:DNA-directed RNA polymerase specialized sigma24 family protein